MDYGLSDDIINRIQEVFKKYPQVEGATLYGSRAMGTYRNGSDIDLTLKGKSINHNILNKISNDIDDLLMPYKFDLSIMDDIDNKDLLKHINRVGIEFYQKK
mgnify:CR=1 FL=1